MKILWHSNAPWAATGYGNQTRLFTTRLRDMGHEVSISAFYGLQGAMLTWEGMRVYPAGYEVYGNDAVMEHARHCAADIVITLIDAWVLNPQVFNSGKAKWVPWAPVDHEPVPPAVLRALAPRDQDGKPKPGAWRVAAYSKHAVAEYAKVGIQAAYIPHGIDTAVYAPLAAPEDAPADRKAAQNEARKKIGLPPDVFIVGMVAANKGTPSRKSFAEVFEAFGRFRKFCPEAILYCHTEPTGVFQGVPLAELIQMVGHRLRQEGAGDLGPEHICFPNQHNYKMGLPDSYMMNAYNAMDVLCSPSQGEGFGIPILEAQACGTPVIVTDFSAMSELCFAGWRVQGQKIYTTQAAWQVIPNVKEITKALQSARASRGAARLAHEARKGAEAYDADLVAEHYWKPFLAQVERDLQAEQAPAPAAADILGVLE